MNSSSKEVLESAPTVSRNVEIDGIRGWAALTVVMFHLMHAIFRFVWPIFEDSPLYFFFDGDLAVFVFFVLSGDALSVGFLQSGRRVVIDRLLLKRYFRLTIPIALSCLAAYVVLSAGLNYNTAASKLTHAAWLDAFLNFEPHFGPMVLYAVYGVYAAHDVATSYNPFLWTMSIEMIGSMLVFLYLYVSTALSRPIVVAGFVAVALYAVGSYFTLFFAGIVLSSIRRDGFFEQLRRSTAAQAASVAVFVAVVVVVALVGHFEAATPWRFYFSSFIAIIVVTCFYANRIALVFFRSWISRVLGALSFPLYLTQACVLVSLTSWMIVRMPTLTHVEISVIVVVSIAACLAAAWALYAVERPILKLLDRLARHRVMDSAVNR